MSLDQTGEVRLYSRKMAAWPTQRACSETQSRFDVLPVALLRDVGSFTTSSSVFSACRQRQMGNVGSIPYRMLSPVSGKSCASL